MEWLKHIRQLRFDFLLKVKDYHQKFEKFNFLNILYRYFR